MGCKWFIWIGNVEKFVANLHIKEEYVIDIRNIEQGLNHGLVLKKVRRINKLDYQNAWLKSYFDINTDLKKQ